MKHAVSNCIAIAEMLSESPEEKIQAVLPVVLRLASDNSYRVRWSVASHMGKLGQVFGPDITQSQLLPCLQKLLQDAKSKVGVVD